MIRIENYEVTGWEHAIRGMRNPMNSWEKGDTEYWSNTLGIHADVGPNDHNLMMKLAKGGSVHAKYRRMIAVYVDITAPLYWWKEFDTYKVGTVANSCSTMHKIHDKAFTLEDFSCEHLMSSNDVECEFYGKEEDHEIYLPYHAIKMRSPLENLKQTIDTLNFFRNRYLTTKTKPMKDEAARKALMKKYWWQMIQLLPSSYNQKRTVMFNYEVLTNIYRWRKNHKLDEWREFCKWIEQLPYSEVITGVEDVKEEQKYVAYKYEVNIGGSTATGSVNLPENATDDDIRLEIMSDLYDVFYEKEKE